MATVARGRAHHSSRDAYGLPITVSSPRALELYDAGVRELLQFGSAAPELFARAVEIEPEFALARGMVATCHLLAEEGAAARAEIASAQRDAARLTTRERRHLRALALWIEGQAASAEALMHESLAETPRDIVLLQRLFFTYFWQGRSHDMLAATEASLPHLGEDSFIRGLHAFSLEETNQYGPALEHGLAALELNPHDAWAVHAVSHIYYERGDNAAGVEFLPPALARCEGLGYFKTHLSWHLALFELAAGRDDRVWELYRRAIRAQRSTFRAELDDAISLLWRLGLFGWSAETAPLWGELAEIARARAAGQHLVFHETMLGMALAGGRDWDGAAAHLAGLHARAVRTGSVALGEVAIPLLEGLGAFARGDYAATIERLGPIQDRIVEVGGSHAQREVFHDTLLEAYLHLGLHEPAERLILARLEHRPDTARCWYRLGRVATAIDRHDDARAHLSRAQSLWQDADRDAPEPAKVGALLRA